MTRFSVIVNTLDRAGPLADALAAIRGLRDADFELIVVAGPCRDGTDAVLANWGGRAKLLSCPDANLARSRNIGLSAASGDIVAFLDDDAAPHPYWLARLGPVFDDRRVGAAGGFTAGRDGLTFQARKMLCDRMGDAHMVADWFDERALSRPGSPLYPAPMGTNVAFRRQALAEIGGFDETFAYYLEETDVCLRLTDAGWSIRFAPDAFVWHQFAASGTRSERDLPRSLRTLARSKSYFIGLWGGGGGDAEAARTAFRDDKFDLLARLSGDGALHLQERFALLGEVEDGLAEGASLAARRLRDRDDAGSADVATQSGAPRGDWDGAAATAPFLPFVSAQAQGKLRAAFLCRRYPPRDEGGVGRWTKTLAEAMARHGHIVHVICEARSAERLRFVEGVWMHEIVAHADEVEAGKAPLGLPQAAAAFALAARKRIDAIKSFGLDVASFPIWDVEGAALLGDPDMPVVMSLHTTFGLALPSRPDWRDDPLFRAEVADPMRDAEAEALRRADLLLANSRAIVGDIEKDAGVMCADRAFLAPHGVEAPDAPPKPAESFSPGEALLCAFIGRAEGRKGLDVAVTAIARARAAGAVARLVVAGASAAQIRAALPADAASECARLEAERALEIRGVLPREELEALMRDADVVLTPSRYESFGLVVAEAMAQGTPALATAVGGLAEVIEDGRTGFLIPLEEGPDGFARRIAELAADRSRLAAASLAAYQEARARFSVAAMANSVEEGLREAIRRFRAGRAR